MITVHHLNYSRSTRALIAAEELGLEYNVERYERGSDFLAPTSLAAVHPLGKAPVLTDGDLVIAESSVILEYLNETYGNNRLAPEPGTPERVAHDEWLQFVESTAAFPIMIALIGGMRGWLSDGMAKYAKGGVKKMLDFLNASLGDGPYLMGPDFTLADIQFSYVLELARSAGMLEPYPAIAAYLDRVKSRDSVIRALEIGGPMAPPRR